MKNAWQSSSTENESRCWGVTGPNCGNKWTLHRINSTGMTATHWEPVATAGILLVHHHCRCPAHVLPVVVPLVCHHSQHPTDVSLVYHCSWHPLVHHRWRRPTHASPQPVFYLCIGTAVSLVHHCSQGRSLVSPQPHHSMHQQLLHLRRPAIAGPFECRS